MEVKIFYRNEIQNSIVSYKRVSEIFGWFKSRRNLELKEIPLKKEIYLKKICYKYPESDHGIKNINLNIRKGQTIGRDIHENRRW